MAKYRPMTDATFAVEPVFLICAISSSMYFAPLEGGVSRPSRKACMYILSSPFFLNMSRRPRRWLMWLCTPPSERRPMRCRGLAGGLEAGGELYYLRVGVESAFVYDLAYPRQLLVHDAARAHREVSHL